MSADAVKHIMATIFSAQNALRDLAPDFKWAGMGNLLGDFLGTRTPIGYKWQREEDPET